MKKVHSILLVIIFLFLTLTVVKAKEKVVVNIFWTYGCPHCENAKQFFDEFKKENDYFMVKEFEVSRNSLNQELLKDTGRILEENVSSVPFIVIGDKGFSGYNTVIRNQMKNTIIEYYENNYSIDIVSELLSQDKYVNASPQNNLSYILLGVVVTIMIIVGLVISRLNKSVA